MRAIPLCLPNTEEIFEEELLSHSQPNSRQFTKQYAESDFLVNITCVYCVYIYCICTINIGRRKVGSRFLIVLFLWFLSKTYIEHFKALWGTFIRTPKI